MNNAKQNKTNRNLHRWNNIIKYNALFEVDHTLGHMD